MEFELLPLKEEQMVHFKTDMQETFRKGAEESGACGDEEVLPASHIDRSLATNGSVAYGAFVGGELSGGAIVVIDEETQHNHLDFLYVKYGTQSRGIGQKIWDFIEKLHPDTKIWETYTSYFEKRNIHFYVNRCGFHVVEFFNKYHHGPRDPDMNDDCGGDGFDGMFRFEKKMK